MYAETARSSRRWHLGRGPARFLGGRGPARFLGGGALQGRGEARRSPSRGGAGRGAAGKGRRGLASGERAVGGKSLDYQVREFWVALGRIGSSVVPRIPWEAAIDRIEK